MSGVAAFDREAIARACEEFSVARLRMFGSAVTGEFDPATSDVDFLVDFGPDAPRTMTPFLGLKDELERITGRDVDLVESAAVRNPYFARRVFAEAVDVYAA